MADHANRQERRKARTRAAILTAAEGLFGIRGVEGVSVDDITSAADVAKGTFYNHFQDKESLAQEVARLIRQEVGSRVGKANAEIADPATRIARAIVVFLYFACTEPDRARAMSRLYRGAADPENPVNRRVTDDMNRGLATGRFQAPSFLSAILFVMGGVYASLAFIVENPDRDGTRRLAREVSGLVLLGLGLDPLEADAIAAQAAEDIFNEPAERL